MKLPIKKIIYYLLGTFTLALGITLSINAKLGAGAFDSMNNNLSQLLKVSLGTGMYISVLILFIITMILKPRKIYFLGVILTLLITIAVDLLMMFIPNVFIFSFRMLYFGFAIIFLPLGIAFIIRSRLPLSPMDNLLLILQEKIQMPVWVVKSIIEGSFAIIALIYGVIAGIGIGALSIGTIVITFTIGPGIDLFLRMIKQI